MESIRSDRDVKLQTGSFRTIRLAEPVRIPARETAAETDAVAVLVRNFAGMGQKAASNAPALVVGMDDKVVYIQSAPPTKVVNQAIAESPEDVVVVKGRQPAIALCRSAGEAAFELGVIRLVA